jgi:hypothetical protein
MPTKNKFLKNILALLLTFSVSFLGFLKFCLLMKGSGSVQIITDPTAPEHCLQQKKISKILTAKKEGELFKSFPYNHKIKGIKLFIFVRYLLTYQTERDASPDYWSPLAYCQPGSVGCVGFDSLSAPVSKLTTLKKSSVADFSILDPESKRLRIPETKNSNNFNPKLNSRKYDSGC